MGASTIIIVTNILIRLCFISPIVTSVSAAAPAAAPAPTVRRGPTLAPEAIHAPSPSKAMPLFDVTRFGAVGDGKTDDSKAFVKAWRSACDSIGSPTLIVPHGKTFLLKPIAFLGPCKSSQIQFSLQGTLVAPNNMNGWTNCKEKTWIYFENVRRLFFNGLGKIDGMGSLWWHKFIPSGNGCKDRPTALRFNSCNGLQINGTTHVNSPQNHIQIEASQNVKMSNLHITAPSDSPNTDGIDIATSSNVFIRDSFIGTGDDCIAIKGGSYFINITGVRCGPGHGISVGSLGENGAHDIVEHVYVSDCTLTGTTNGARIKTWQGGSGHVSDIIFQDITLDNSKNPIIIDQAYYGPNNLLGTLKVSDVTFRGTSATKEALSLQCNGKTPCTNLKFDNIKITSKSQGSLISKCENAYGTVVPPVMSDVDDCLLE